MLNIIWSVMLLSGIVWGLLTGQLQAVSDAFLTSAEDAVMLCVKMLGIVGMWSGVMEIAQKGGAVEVLKRWLEPWIRLLFPRIPKEHPARQAIALNMAANILGLGWAATPAGIKAMEELEALEQERKTEAYLEGSQKPRAASNEMCTFLVINISSLQLIPVNMIAYRSQYHSSNPALIVGPAMLATLVSTMTAILFCKGMDRITRDAPL